MRVTRSLNDQNRTQNFKTTPFLHMETNSPIMKGIHPCRSSNLTAKSVHLMRVYPIRKNRNQTLRNQGEKSGRETNILEVRHQNKQHPIKRLTRNIKLRLNSKAWTLQIDQTRRDLIRTRTRCSETVRVKILDRQIQPGMINTDP